jgi:hypothetical protein
MTGFYRRYECCNYRLCDVFDLHADPGLKRKNYNREGGGKGNLPVKRLFDLSGDVGMTRY